MERLAMESWPQVDRRDGQDEAAERQAAPSSAPASLVQEISALWGEHLNGREVGADDDFFVLGGTSLIGIKIIDRIAQDYGVELSVRAFYLAQTPARVAELIEQRRRALP
jgi:acyl carrier protein